MVCSCAGGGCRTGSPPPAEGVRGCHPWKIRIWGQFGPQNKLIEGQSYEYDVICRNASVLAFHLWPTIFAGAPFWFQNICWNGVPPRSRTTTPLHVSSHSSEASCKVLDLLTLLVWVVQVIRDRHRPFISPRDWKAFVKKVLRFGVQTGIFDCSFDHTSVAFILSNQPALPSFIPLLLVFYKLFSDTCFFALRF